MTINIRIRPIGHENILFATNDPEAAARWIADNWDNASHFWTWADRDGQMDTKLADDIDLLGADMADIRRRMSQPRQT